MLICFTLLNMNEVKIKSCRLSKKYVNVCGKYPVFVRFFLDYDDVKVTDTTF